MLDAISQAIERKAYLRHSMVDIDRKVVKFGQRTRPASAANGCPSNRFLKQQLDEMSHSITNKSDKLERQKIGFLR